MRSMRARYSRPPPSNTEISSPKRSLQHVHQMMRFFG